MKCVKAVITESASCLIAGVDVMDTKTRAEKIRNHTGCHHCVDEHCDCVEFIASQLEEAVREAAETALDEARYKLKELELRGRTKGYDQGYRDASIDEDKRAYAQAQKEVLLREQVRKEAIKYALEQAAEIMDQECGNGCSEEHRKYITQRIRALEGKL